MELLNLNKTFYENMSEVKKPSIAKKFLKDIQTMPYEEKIV